MIFVQPQPEPADFDCKVRQPGLKYLQKNPGGKLPRLWGKVISDLWTAYDGICAYSCHWFPLLGGESVDHFVPQTINSQLAYEWSNYRLTLQKMNSRKRADTNIVDPFTITGNWFVLVFPALLVKANSQLSDTLKSKVQHTIEALKLNEEALVNIRLGYVLEYCDGDITLRRLYKRAPFVTYELERQKLTETIKVMMKRRRISSSVP